jgi:hypothetical protein
VHYALIRTLLTHLVGTAVDATLRTLSRTDSGESGREKERKRERERERERGREREKREREREKGGVGRRWW